MRKKTVLMTIDQELVALVDLIAVTEGTNRSAITRKALQERTDRYNKTNTITEKAKDILDSNKILNDTNSSSTRWTKQKKFHSGRQNSKQWSWSSLRSTEGSQSEMMSGRTKLMSAWNIHSGWDVQEEQASNIQQDVVQDTKWNMVSSEWSTAAGEEIPMKWDSKVSQYVDDFPIW